MCLLCGGAFLHLRRNWYEIFLLTHIVMAVLFIVGGWYHVVELGFVEYFYASVACWSLDRAVRIIKLILFGVAKAKVTLTADETLRIVVPKPKLWKSTPGGYAFIHFLKPSCFWQSHPFTYVELPNNSTEIILYCKVKGGVTHGLYQNLAKQPENTGFINVTLEGQYGEAAPVKYHSSAVFIAGGNGVPGLYSEIVELLKNPIKDQRIKFYWVIREHRSLLWFYSELMALKDSRVEIVIYVTNTSSTEYFKDLHDMAGEEKDETEKRVKIKDDQKDGVEIVDESESVSQGSDNFDASSITTIKEGLGHIEFEEGRPDVRALIVREIEESAGPIGFVTCGNLRMVDEIRNSVADNVGRGRYRVDFFEQLETWA